MCKKDEEKNERKFKYSRILLIMNFFYEMNILYKMNKYNLIMK